jgi:preprotein translocase subunit SecE
VAPADGESAASAARRATVPPRVTAEELRRERAESKAAARKGAEESKAGSGIGGRIVNGERTAGVRKFTRETLAEIKKVNWPDRETTRNLTLLVIAVSVTLGLVLGGLDYVLFQIFEALP